MSARTRPQTQEAPRIAQSIYERPTGFCLQCGGLKEWAPATNGSTESRPTFPLEELREKLRLIDQEEVALCRVHSRTQRPVASLEDLPPAELEEWLKVVDYALRLQCSRTATTEVAA